METTREDDFITWDPIPTEGSLRDHASNSQCQMRETTHLRPGYGSNLHSRPLYASTSPERRTKR